MTQEIGVAKVVQGQMTASGPEGTHGLHQGSPVFKGDTILTAKGSAGSIEFLDHSILNVGEASKVSLDQYVYDASKGTGKVLFKMAQGTFRAVTGEIVKHNPESFKLQSPLATIGIRGTETAHTIPPEGEGSESHLVMVFDGKPVIVQPLAGGGFQVLSQGGVKVEVGKSGAGPVLVMTPQEYKYYQALTQTGIQQGAPTDTISTSQGTSMVKDAQTVAIKAAADAAAKAAAETAAKAAAEAAAKAAADAAKTGDPAAKAAADAAAKAAADAAAKAALDAKAAADVAAKAAAEAAAALQAQAMVLAAKAAADLAAQQAQQQGQQGQQGTVLTLSENQIIHTSDLTGQNGQGQGQGQGTGTGSGSGLLYSHGATDVIDNTGTTHVDDTTTTPPTTSPTLDLSSGAPVSPYISSAAFTEVKLSNQGDSASVGHDAMGVSIIGGTGNDSVTYLASGSVTGTIDGGGGDNTLAASANTTIDFTAATILNIQNVSLGSGSTGTFTAAQIDTGYPGSYIDGVGYPAHTSSVSTLTGSGLSVGGATFIVKDPGSNWYYDFSHTTFANWGSADVLDITGSSTYLNLYNLGTNMSSQVHLHGAGGTLEFYPNANHADALANVTDIGKILFGNFEGSVTLNALPDLHHGSVLVLDTTDMSPMSGGTLTLDASNVTVAGLDYHAGGANDHITGTHQADTFNFGKYLSSNDHINGNGGDDTLNFAADSSTPSTALANVSNVQHVNLLLGDPSMSGGVSLTLPENIVGSTSTLHFDAHLIPNNLSLDATALAAKLDFTGGTENDSIDRGTHLTSADTLTGGGGSDSLRFVDDSTKATQLANVTGFANIFFDNTSTNANEKLAGNASVPSGGLYVDASSIDLDHSLTFDASKVTSTSLSLHITGGAGNDTITGGAGTDDISGSGGNDSIIGSTGNDTIHGDGGTDTLDYTALGQSYTVTYSLTGEGAGVVHVSDGDGLLWTQSFTGIETVTGATAIGLTCTATDFEQSFTGTEQDDTFAMGQYMTSASVIDGGGGSNTLSFTQQAQGSNPDSPNELWQTHDLDNVTHIDHILLGDAVTSLTPTSDLHPTTASDDGEHSAPLYVDAHLLTHDFTWDGGSLSADNVSEVDLTLGTAGTQTIDCGERSIVYNVDASKLTLTGADHIYASLYGMGGTLTVNALDGTNALDDVTGFGTIVFKGSADVIGHDLLARYSPDYVLTLDGSGLSNDQHLHFDGSDIHNSMLNLLGGAGADILIGGDGDNNFYSNGGDDTLTGGHSNDYYAFSSVDSGGHAVVTDPGGNTLIEVSGTTDLSHASFDLSHTDQVVLQLDEGADVTLGADLLVQAQYIEAGSGDFRNHFYVAGTDGTAETLTFVGTVGNDVLDASSLTLTGCNSDIGTWGAQDTLILNGLAGDDTITGSSGTDSISGGDGNDTVYMGAHLTSADTLDGGAGTNTLHYTADDSDTGQLANVSNFQHIVLDNTSSDAYVTATNSLFPAAGALYIDASSIDSGHSLHFDASDIGGYQYISLDITGGAGSDFIHFTNANVAATVHGTTGADNITNITSGGDGADLTVDYSDMTANGYELHLTSSDGNLVSTAQDAGLRQTLGGVSTVLGVITHHESGSWADSITGGGGDDYIEANFGGDVLNGGGHNTDPGGHGNTVSYEGMSSGFLGFGVVVNLSSQGLGTMDFPFSLNPISVESGHSYYAGGSDTLTNFQNVVGTHFADYIVGPDNQTSTIEGLGNMTPDTTTDPVNHNGTEQYYACLGDTLTGGAGSVNTVSYEHLASAQGGVFVDLDPYQGPQTADYQVALDSTHTAYVQDTLQNFQNVIGTYSADYIYGGTGDNVIEGLGNFNGSSLGDTLIGGEGVPGTDTVSYQHLSTGVEVHLDYAVHDSSWATQYATYEYMFHGDGDFLVTVSDHLSGFQNAIGSVHDDKLYGNGGDNVLNGLAGNDILAGFDTGSTVSGGNDTLIGGSGDDLFYAGHGSNVIYGGTVLDGANTTGGHDTVDYSYADHGVNGFIDHGVSVDLTHQWDTTDNDGINLTDDAHGTAWGTYNGVDFTDTLHSIENVIGTHYNDVITGDSHDNVLSGGDGNDYLSGGAGDDTLYGGDGDDVLIGGAGNNHLHGDGGSNVVDYSGATGSVTADLNVGFVSANGYGGQDTLENIQHYIGSNHGDHITAGADTTSIQCGSGDDTIHMDTHLSYAVSVDGGQGVDTLYFTQIVDQQQPHSDDLEHVTGVEIIKLGDADTSLLASGFGGYGGSNLGLGLDSGHDYLTIDGSAITSAHSFGFEAIGDCAKFAYNIIGGSGGNTLIGGDMNDTITGGSGSSTIVGGLGADSLTGGNGPDLFIYRSISEGGDTINHFHSGTDQIGFLSSNYGETFGFATQQDLEGHVYTSMADYNSTEHQSETGPCFYFNETSHQLIYDTNGHDAGGEHVMATLTGVNSISTHDITIAAEAPHAGGGC